MRMAQSSGIKFIIHENKILIVSYNDKVRLFKKVCNLILQAVSIQRNWP